MGVFAEVFLQGVMEKVGGGMSTANALPPGKSWPKKSAALASPRPAPPGVGAT